MRIVVDELIPHADRAFASFGDVTVLPGRAINAAAVRDADVLITRSVTRINATLLDDSRVRFVGSATSGIDHVDSQYLRNRGIAFAAAHGTNALAVAEYVIAAIAEQIDRIGPILRPVVVGVVGVGAVGARVVEYCGALGMTVLECDPPRADSTGDARYLPLNAVLDRSDFVTVHVPLTHDGPHPTAGMIDNAWIDRMRPGATLINTSRGEVHVEPVLRAARESGALGGLVLDVFADEPDVSRQTVRACDFATFHIAGHSEPAKRAGTEAMVAALAAFCGSPSAWTPPPLTMQTVELPRQVFALEAVLCAVRRVLDLPGLTRGFQTVLKHGKSNGAAFDLLRRMYEPRPEYAQIRIEGELPQSARAVLETLGFRTDGAEH
jgi:erythronate-4-phosphate dehydrogenase